MINVIAVSPDLAVKPDKQPLDKLLDALAKGPTWTSVLCHCDMLPTVSITVTAGHYELSTQCALSAIPLKDKDIQAFADKMTAELLSRL